MPISNQNDESKLRKIIVRTAAGFVMASMMVFVLRGGALYCILFGIATQIELFRELVNVRYVEAKGKNIPFFRTLQWSWFALAMFYTYGENLHEFCLRHGHLVSVTVITQYYDAAAFSLYCAVFVATVLTFRTGMLRFQINQLLWTLVTVAMVVLQTKFLASCVLYGLFWFFFPMATVASNDVFAYICGMAFGRKLINVPLISLSPKKTWEGFIGAAIATCVFSFYFPVLLADIPWFTCPAEKLSFIPQPLSSINCEVNTIFLPHHFVFLGVTLVLRPIQLHGLAYGAFASLIAPFGGFLASAIKRGYKIKDFDHFIPGHGGVMDRMDCQLIIHLFTYVHLKTVVSTRSISRANMASIIGIVSMLGPEELVELQQQINTMIKQLGNHSNTWASAT